MKEEFDLHDQHDKGPSPSQNMDEEDQCFGPDRNPTENLWNVFLEL